MVNIMPNSLDTTVLSERDCKILRQGEAGLILPEVTHRCCFPDGTLEAARSAIRRLCGPEPENQYLASHSLDAHRVFYQLTPLAVKTLGLHPKCSIPPKKLGRVRRYALTWFIHGLHPGQRVLMNLPEFAEHYHLQGHRLPRHPFFLDKTSGRERIGMILIDHNAHVRQIVHKTIRPLGRFLRHGWFNEFVMTGSFLVAILTFSHLRRRAIQMQLENAIEKHFRYVLNPMRAASPATHNAGIEVLATVIPGMDAVLAAPSSVDAKIT
jgi:hypothetical protein